MYTVITKTFSATNNARCHVQVSHGLCNVSVHFRSFYPLWVWGSRISPVTKQFWDNLCKARVFKSGPHPRWGTTDAEIKGPPGGSPGLSKVPFSPRPVAGPNKALHAVPAYWAFYLPRFFFCLPVSFNFSFPKFLQSSMVECALSHESERLLVVGTHFCFTLT